MIIRSLDSGRVARSHFIRFAEALAHQRFDLLQRFAARFRQHESDKHQRCYVNHRKDKEGVVACQRQQRRKGEATAALQIHWKETAAPVSTPRTFIGNSSDISSQ